MVHDTRTQEEREQAEIKAGIRRVDAGSRRVEDSSYGLPKTSTPTPMPACKPVKCESALAVQQGGDHYKKMKIQPVEFIHANGIPFIEGSVIKYVSRWRNKNGIDDLKKAKHFLDLLIELEEKANNG